MRYYLLLIILSLAFIMSNAQTEPSRIDKISYAIGLDAGRNLKKTGVELNQEEVMRGLKEALAGETGSLSEEEVKNLLQAFSTELMNMRIQKEKEKGQKFLEENAKKEGVVQLPSGLQYKVLTAGPADGISPTKSNQVEVNYEGKLLDGTIFDSSYQRGQSISFGVTQVIPGWTEILQLMKPGDVREVYIPADLAYGDRGAGRDIPGGATLIFKVELIAVK